MSESRSTFHICMDGIEAIVGSLVTQAEKNPADAGKYAEAILDIQNKNFQNMPKSK